MKKSCDGMHCKARATHQTNHKDGAPEYYFCKQHAKNYKLLIKIDSK
ncbi:hypothetical protein SEA_SCHWARTZ33_76 [Gordonia phage Schwartz33]|nr:hypothetical protein SEA_SCHWARTZ33_76 [Gordonia phage Schwartz33]